jgi:putative inorganic carbon (hco3(-)) transporter
MITRSEDYPYVSKLALILFAGYVITWYLQIGERIRPLGSIRFELIYALFLTCVAVSISGKKFDSPLSGYLIAYFFALLIQIPLSYDPETSILIFYNRIIKFSFLAFFIIVFVRSPTGLRYFLGAFFLACMKIGQEGLIGRITGGMIWESQGVMRLHGTTSLYAHPNSLSGNAIGTLPFILYLFAISPIFIKVALLLQSMFAANIILYTASRTGYVAILAFLLFLIGKNRANFRKMILIFIIAFICIQFLPEQYIGRFQSIFTGHEAEGHSSQTRIQILKDAVYILLTHPLGVGVAAFPKIRMDTFGRFQDTHNLYLEVATNLGIQGFIIFFLFVIKMLKLLKDLKNDFSQQITSLINAENKDQDTLIKSHIKDLKLMKATSESVYLFIILRLILGIFGMDLYEIYWWFAFGLTVSLWNMSKYAAEKTILLKRQQSSDIQ